MRRFALLLVVLAVGCGGDAGGGATGGPAGIWGRVTIGPQCPVVQEGSPCPDAPYAATVQIIADGEVVASGRSGEDGTFRIPVEPGTYTVHGVPLDENGIASAQDVQGVRVTAGAFTRVDLSFDSGIR
jgi:hypothetical protein